MHDPYRNVDNLGTNMDKDLISREFVQSQDVGGVVRASLDRLDKKKLKI